MSPTPDDFRLTKQDDLLAALVVAENSDNPMLQNAVQNLIMVAKLSDSDGFVEAKASFSDKKTVVFVNQDKAFDKAMALFAVSYSGQK
jgi:hypothetical protein